MSHTLSLAEAARHLGSYVDRVAEHGERFVLTRGEEPVAELRPLVKSRRLTELPALLAGLPHLSETEAADLAADVDAARRELSTMEIDNPWQS